MITLTEVPESFTMESVHMQCIERFVVLMYSKSCGSATVNDARHRLFSNGSRSLDSIPPTQATLFEHVKRSLLQVLSGSSQSLVTKKSQSLINGDGNRISTTSNGSHSGPPWLTQARLLPSSCTVDAYNHAGGIVNAAGQAFVAHHCASASVAA